MAVSKIFRKTIRAKEREQAKALRKKQKAEYEAKQAAIAAENAKLTPEERKARARKAMAGMAACLAAIPLHNTMP